MNKKCLIILSVSLPLACLADNESKKNNLISALEENMKYSLKRHVVLSENISAQSVPGYRAKDLKKIDFNNKQKNGKNSLVTATTNPGHINRRISTNNFKVIEEKLDDNTSIMKNNVNLADEMVKVNDNLTSYNLATSLYKKTTGLMKLAIGR